MIIIYRLLNTINNKGYVGQTSRSLKDRWDSGHGYLGCTYINNAINKYGSINFYYDILMVIENDDQIVADYWEEYYINIFDYRNMNRGYNLREGGAGGHLADETKQKISSAKIGKYIGKDNPNFGNRWSQEQREVASKRMIGIGIGEKNNFYDKDHTDEVKQIISVSTKTNHKLGKYKEANIKKRKFSYEQELQIVERYLVGNITIQDLCDMFDMSYDLFDTIRKRYNIKTIKQPKTTQHLEKIKQSQKKASDMRRGTHTNETLDLQQKVVALRSKGLLQKEIAQILEIHQVRVSQLLIAADMRSQTNQKRKK